MDNLQNLENRVNLEEKMMLPKISNRKIVILIISFLFFTFSFVKIAQAKYVPVPAGAPSQGQMPALLKQVKEEYEADDTNLGQFSRFLVDKGANAGTHALLGIPIIEGQEGPTGSVFGTTAAMIAGLYQPPVSTTEYLADISQNIGLIQPAYAQGTGWHALQPILKIWKVCRDLAYLFMVVIFVAIGMMIMFRAKIDPQTVASIQSALPQLVLALLLITFSYAIAGLIFDLMEFGTTFLTSLIVDQLAEYPPGYGPRGEERWNIFRLAMEALGEIVKLEDIDIPQVGLLALVNLVQGILTALGAGNSITQFVLAIVLVFTAFKLFFALLSRYVIFILTTIFGPLLLIFSAIPGKGNIAGTWLKALIKAAIVFPAVYAVLAIAAIISNAPAWKVLQEVQITEPLYAPRMLSVVSDPSMIKNLLGLGILLISPSIPDMIDQAFEKRPGPPAFAAAAQTIRGVVGRMPIIGGLAAGI